MMKISSVSLFNSMLGLVLMVLTPINSSAKDNANILQATGLSDKVIEVTASPIKNLDMVVLKGGGVVYVSKDGQFLFEGRMIGESPEGPVDLTAPIERQGRAKTIDSISSEKFITYKAKGDLISYVTVFTDVGCPFCQKFHKEIDELTSAGIGVRYLPFPRSGVNGKDFAPLKSIWCAKNPKDAMDSAMKNRRIPEASCSSADIDIQASFELGRAMKVRGTPAIIFPDGEIVIGYIDAKSLINKLKK